MVNYPKDWDKIKLSELMTPYNGLSGKSGNDFINGKEKYINYLSVFNNTVIESATEKVNIYNDEIQNIVNEGDILFTQSSETAEEVGMASTYLGDEKVYLNSFCFGTRKKREFDSFFMVSLLRSKEVRKKISKEGQGSTRYNLSPTRLLNIEINMPKDVDEQKAISKVLLSFDKHIENLSKLIEKKKMIRDGAVEELLSGYKRMKKNKPWKEFKLEEVCVPRGMVRGPFGGSLKKDAFIYKGYKVYEQKNAIYKSINLGDYYIDENKYDELSRFSVKENDFIVSCSGTIGEIYRIPHNYVPGVINQALLKLTIDDNICDFNLFNHYFNWNKFKHKIIDDTQGGAMKNLVGMDKFRKTTIYIPTDTEEQKIIAEILSSMDKEIENLEKEKEKYQQLKSGTMDDLLTGKIRLV